MRRTFESGCFLLAAISLTILGICLFGEEFEVNLWAWDMGKRHCSVVFATLTLTLQRCACASAWPTACLPHLAGPASQSHPLTCTWHIHIHNFFGDSLCCPVRKYWAQRVNLLIRKCYMLSQKKKSWGFTCRCHSWCRWGHKPWPGRWAHAGSGWPGQSPSPLSAAVPGSFPWVKIQLIRINRSHFGILLF